MIHFGDRLEDMRCKKLAEKQEYYVLLHDLSQFYFEYMFLAFLGLPDIQQPRGLLSSEDVMVS